MTIAVLAVQGAFIEHEQILQRLGVATVEIRKKEDLQQPYDGIILPGGESTVQGKLLHELSLYDTIREQIENGMPVLATCAGMILLADSIAGESKRHFGTIPMTVKRNAYGRQLGSFRTTADMKKIGTVPMTFIRAPYVEKAAPDVEILATVEDKIVAVQYFNQIALAFHPELDDRPDIHQYFVNLCKNDTKSHKICYHT